MLYRVNFYGSYAYYSNCFTDKAEAEKFYNMLLREGYKKVQFQEG